MTSSALAAIKARLTLSQNDTNKNESTITTYKGIVNHLLKRNATDAKITKADERISNLGNAR